MSRRLARELALKILYCYISGRTEIFMILNEFLNKKKYQSTVKAFSRKLVMLTIENMQTIDEQVKSVLQNWNYDRISTIDKLILRLGVCELLFFDDIPYEVTINEAVEMAKKYGTTESQKFVNGVLDAVVKKEKAINKQ
ncbi:MAG: transcription antitermination factor NusB [bacterium]